MEGERNESNRVAAPAGRSPNDQRNSASLHLQEVGKFALKLGRPFRHRQADVRAMEVVLARDLDAVADHPSNERITARPDFDCAFACCHVSLPRLRCLDLSLASIFQVVTRVSRGTFGAVRSPRINSRLTSLRLQVLLWAQLASGKGELD